MTIMDNQNDLFEHSVNTLLGTLECYGESYLKDCVDAELQAFELTHDLKDFKKAIEVAVVCAIHIISTSLRNCLLSGSPKRTIDGYKSHLSAVIRLL